MSLFALRSLKGKQEVGKPKISDFLSYRDTWTEIPSKDFSMHRIVLRARLEKHRKSIVKLVRTENGYTVANKNELDDIELQGRNFKSAMNKLTKQNYSAVVEPVLTKELVRSEQLLNEAVEIIFKKAVMEPVFASLYARVITDIEKYERKIRSSEEGEVKETTEKVSKPVTLRSTLLGRCQKYFEQFVKESEKSEPIDEEKADEIKENNRANIKFVGELYLHSSLADSVIVHVVDMVMGNEQRATDANVELGIKLMEVVGAKFDEMAKEDQKNQVWGLFVRCKTYKLTKRIQFLLENLLDQRNNNWKSKASMGSSTAGSSSAKNTPAPQQTTQRIVATSHSTTTTNTNTDGPQNRNWQQNKQRQHNNNNNNSGGGGSGNKPVHRLEGFSHGTNHGTHSPQSQSPSVPSRFTAPTNEVSSEEKKMIALATPPQAFTPQMEESFVGSIRSALEEGNTSESWSETHRLMKDTFKEINEPEHVAKMCAAYAVIKHMCLTSRDEERQLFTAVLNNTECFDDTSYLSRGFSWFLTYAIAQDLKEDCPRLNDRFKDSLMATTSMTFPVVLRDVLARTANYLDALSTHDETDFDHQASLADVWSSVVSKWRVLRPEEDVKPEEVLQALEGVKQRPFMRAIAPDCLVALLNGGFLTLESVKLWQERVKQSKTKEAQKVLMEQLTDLISTD